MPRTCPGLYVHAWRKHDFGVWGRENAPQFFVVWVLMLLEIDNLDVAPAVYLIPIDKAITLQLVQQFIDLAVVAWKKLDFYLCRPVLHAPAAICQTPESGKQNARQRLAGEHLVAGKEIGLYVA